jgi:hypothetical protein
MVQHDFPAFTIFASYVVK